ncbi:hypothetical protein BAE44_0016892, partial [Dichanthelium oligosanthes]
LSPCRSILGAVSTIQSSLVRYGTTSSKASSLSRIEPKGVKPWPSS